MTRGELREYTRQLLGIADVEAQLWRVIAPEATARGGALPEAPPDATAAALRSRGAQLLRRSADVRTVDDTHPAYGRMLAELTPDEARILRFLFTEGPQPSVDVRTSRPLNLGTQMVGSGLTMIGVLAGCRRPERVPAYLNNLFRLGLVWFGGGRTVRRSIELTPFGKDFCGMVLPLDRSEAETAGPVAKLIEGNPGDS
jgi:hypothetical protein